MVNFKLIYHFQGSRGGPTFSRGGGVQLFPGGGGSNCLFPIETHIICYFPGGSGSALDASETPFKWRFADGPMMARFKWYLDPLSPH